ncbi:hypothetical protein L208DRAFT_1305312 [Tricholoma matsutake]|nr:hypothetical protein L208DRAFT_1305312 [Tricholoma matsutake 945]
MTGSDWLSFPGQRRQLLQPDGDELEAAHSTPHSPVAYVPPPGPSPDPPPAPSSTLDHSDNQPTSISKLGHPLVRDRKLLVYPRGCKCPKCEYNFCRTTHMTY